MTSHRRRRRFNPPMRPDDRVGPGLRRRVAYALTGIALLGFGIAIPLAFQTVNQDQQLTRDEVTELRSYLGERRAVREQESAQIDTRLDEQSAALCAAIGEVSRDATTSGRRALARAGERLDCGPLPPKRSRASSTPSTSSSSRTSGPSPQPVPTPTTTPRPSVPAQATTRPRPTQGPSPAPSATASAAEPGRTCTVQVLGICL